MENVSPAKKKKKIITSMLQLLERWLSLDKGFQEKKKKIQDTDVKRNQKSFNFIRSSSIHAFIHPEVLEEYLLHAIYSTVNRNCRNACMVSNCSSRKLSRNVITSRVFVISF